MENTWPSNGHVSNQFGSGVLHLTQTVWWVRRRRKSVRRGEKRGRKERKKERKKIRKEERKKEENEEVAYTLRSRWFSYLGYPCLGVIQWPWSLALTWGLVQKQFGNKLCESLGSFGSKKLDFGVGWTC